MSLPADSPDLASLSSLDDPVRRRLYEVVTQQAGPVGRDEAASAAGIGRALAVYHLDSSSNPGCLQRSTNGPPGGPGRAPGAPPSCTPGRTASSPSPCRPANTSGGAAARPGRRVRSQRPEPTALREAAHRLGTDLGSRFRLDEARQDTARRDVKSVLVQHGYEPSRDDDGVIRLRNCPFHTLVERHRDVVCGMNLALVEGLVAGLEADGWHPALDPRPGHCCVAIDGDRP